MKSLCFLIFAFFLSSQQALAQAKGETRNTRSKMFAEINLNTNYVEKGITQTDKNPSLQADVGYQYSSGRIGVWSSNVKYANSSDEYLNMRPYLSFRIDTSATTDISLRYDFNRYFKSSTRDGSIIGIDLNLYGYHVIYEQQEKWEGTSSNRTWYGFSKTWNAPSALTYDTTFGYSMVGADGFSNYFDTRLGANYRSGDFIYSLIHTYNSGASQFNGAGDMAFIFMIAVKF